MIKIHKFTFNPFQENSYLIIDAQSNTIVVDPGMYDSSERQDFDNYIEDNGLTVKLLVNTHCHIDHVLGNHHVLANHDVPFYAHSAEQWNLDNNSKIAEMYGLGGFVEFEMPEFYFDKNQQLKVGEEDFELRYVPGHSPGHVVLIHHGSKNIVGGDVLFDGSIGRTDLPGGNHQQLLSAIEREIFTLPRDYVIHPGHMGSTSVGKEKDTNPFFH